MARPPGARNKRTIEGERFASLILDDPEVLAVYQQKARRGELTDVEFKHLCDLRFGKPTEHLALSRDDAEDLSDMSVEQLVAYFQNALRDLYLVEAADAQFEAEVAAADAQIARRELEAATTLLSSETPQRSDGALRMPACGTLERCASRWPAKSALAERPGRIRATEL